MGCKEDLKHNHENGDKQLWEIYIKKNLLAIKNKEFLFCVPEIQINFH